MDTFPKPLARQSWLGRSLDISGSKRILMLYMFVAALGCRSTHDKEMSSAAHRQLNENTYSESNPQVNDVPIASFTEPEQYPDMLQINSETLTVEDILNPLKPKLLEAAGERTEEEYTRYVVEPIRDELIRQVQDLLLYQEASKSITDQMTEVLDRYVDQEIKDRVNREFGGRQTRLEAYLASRQTSMEEYRGNERRRIIVIKYLQDTIIPKIADPTRQELLDFYHQNINQYSLPEKRELYLIDIPRADEAEQARASINQALTQLRAGEPFETVAKNYSKGIHAKEGGYWNYIKSPLQGRYAQASIVFFELGENEISDIIETEDAFFIVKVGRIQPAQSDSFAEVQPQLVERYRNFQFDMLRRKQIQSLLDKAVIEPGEEKFLETVVQSVQQYYEQSH